MPLPGHAALLMTFDIAQEAIHEHDEWHTHEHLPERLSIPGFVRGTRWIALRGQPRYFVMYEVEQLATLTSDAYLERLNHPSPWTSKMMPHYRGMIRGYCTVSGRCGFGIGHSGLLIQFKPETGAESSLRKWLLDDTLPRLPAMPGIGSAQLFEGAVIPEMTTEQRLRGSDAGFHWGLFLTGYSHEAMENLAHTALRDATLHEHGAEGVLNATYRLDYALTDREVAPCM
jgi:hypothetical protein